MTDSRIQQLRTEITKLGQCISMSTAKKHPTYIPALANSSLDISKDKNDLENEVNSVQISSALKQDHFAKQIDDISTQLKGLAKLRQREVLKRRTDRKALVERTEAIKTDIQNTYVAHTKWNDRQRAVHNTILAKYAERLWPLEQRSLALIETRTEQGQQERTRENLLKMGQEELDSRTVNRLECIMHREELEELLEQLILQNPDEFDIRQDTQDLVSHAKEMQIANLNVVDKEIAQLNSELNTLRDSLDENEELRDFEHLIRLHSDGAGTPSLDDLILDLNCLEDFDIDEEILRIQLTAIQREEKQQELRGEHNHKKAAIQQWKREVEHALGAPRPVAILKLTDKGILEEFASLLFPKLPNTEKRHSVGKLLQIYMQKLHQQGPRPRNELEQALQATFTEKTKLETAKAVMRKGLMKLIMEEEAITRRVQQGDSQVQREALQLRKDINYWESLIVRETSLIQLFTDSKRCQLRTPIPDLTHEEQVVNSKIEKVLNDQKREMLKELNSLPDALNSRLEEKHKTLEEANRELSELDNGNSRFFAAIEQEETMLRRQQQLVNSGIKAALSERHKLELKLHLVRESPRGTDSKSKSMFQTRRTTERQLETKEDTHPSAFNSNSHLEFVKRHFHMAKRVPERTYAKSYRLDLERSTLSEKTFFDNILPLLEGTELYKKFSQRNSLHQPMFDPLDALKRPPESCGYGTRYFRLHKSLSRVDVSQPLKPGIDSSINIEHILAPIIPQRTMAILQLQRKLLNTDLEMISKPTEEKVFEDLRDWGVFNANHQVFKKRSKDCSFYPFSIALEQGGRVDLIARGYTVFNYWISGINALIKYKKVLTKLSSRIEPYISDN